MLLGVLAHALLISCALPQTPLLLEEGELPERLSEWRMLSLHGGRLEVVSAAAQYELNTPLFSDHASKLRTVWIPPGAHIEPSSDVGSEPGALQFPVGTVLTKTFYYPKPGTRVPPTADGRLDLRNVLLLETRVLVHQHDGWQAAAYVWNEAQDDAVIAPGGRFLQPEFDHPHLQRRVRTDYLVPDRNQCASCHARNHASKRMQPLGPRLDNLAVPDARARTDAAARATMGSPQLDAWRARGWLRPAAGTAANLPALARWDDASAPLAARAIAYLDVNCGHCHNATGAADTSALHLDRRSLEAAPQGACKAPVAAGKGTGDLAYDLVPGRASESILLRRMQSTDPGVMMPELGRALVHAEGVRLVADWIDSLPGTCPPMQARRPPST